jgi:glyoxylase-like metal-dependent hydrolase (beta-lactamase superfamily II)
VKVADEIYSFKGIRVANSYLYTADGKDFVIDTGLSGNGKKIASQITALGKDPQKIEAIILTHSDPDHSGSVAELKGITGAKVAIHEGDAPSLSGERALKRAKGVAGSMMRFMKIKTVKPDIILKEGDEIAGLKVIHCPGHTEGSMCLYKPGEILFVGDVVRTDGSGHVKGPTKMMSLDIEEAWESVGKIAKLEFDILLPGHGKPIIHDASKKVKELLKDAV